MTQDTRKDRRVKIVSLNVRYKSATVDEFIENHAHDVSRGGIFIKTTSPFPGGTLLKFEIRLVSDQAVIVGVGRVVWKRDPSTSNAGHPAGMGVKFIKVDEPSKAVIDKLMNTRPDAGRAFENQGDGTPLAPRGSEPPAAKTPSASHAPAAQNNATMVGLGAGASTSVAAPGAAADGAPANRTQPSGENRATALGSGRSSPPRPDHADKGVGMFPEEHAEKEASPKQEQTVMKQAAELLEEALREAGGSMEEVGTNPLFSGAHTSRIPSPAPAAPTDSPKAFAFAERAEKAGSRTARELRPDVEDAAFRAKTMLAGMSPAAAKRAQEAPRAPSEAPKRGPSGDGARSRALRSSNRAPRPGIPRLAIVVGVGAAVALGILLFRDTLFGESAEKSAATPTEVASSVVAAPAAPSSAAPAQAAPSETSVTVATDSATAGVASASAAPASSTAQSVAPSAPIAPRPTPAAIAAPAPKPAAISPTRLVTVPAPSVGPTLAPAPSTDLAGPARTTTPAAAPHPAAAAPRPAPSDKPVDDNPY